MRNLIFILLLISSQFSFSQRPVDSLKVSAITTYSSTTLFQFNRSTSLTISKYETHFPNITQIEIPVLLENRLDNKFSFLSGTKFDLFRTDRGSTSLPLISAVTGLQYNTVRDDLFVQGLFNYQLIKPNKSSFLNTNSRPSFNLRSRIKF